MLSPSFDRIPFVRVSFITIPLFKVRFIGRGVNALLIASLLCLLSTNSRAGEVISGEFELLDHTGKLVTQSSYNNKLRLVFFGFTRCPIICPTTLSEVSRAMRMLESRSDQVQPLFISIDPENDAPELLADYVGAFHPSIIGLTGTPEQVKRAAQAFNVTYGKGPTNDTDDTEEIFHSSYLYLMDRNGDFLDVIGFGTRPEIILEKLEQYL